MPDPHRTPAGITRRALDRVLAATRQAEDHDHNNYNVTRPPAPRDQRGDRHVFPVQVIGSEDGTLAGLWPAAVRYWTGYAGGTPANFADQPDVADCWAFPAPGGADLINSGEYLGVFVGIHTDGKGVFEVVAAGAELTTGNVGDSGAQDSTTTVLRFDEATGSKVTKGLTDADPDVHALLAASATQMGAVTAGDQVVGGVKTTENGSVSGSSAGWYSYNTLRYYTGWLVTPLSGVAVPFAGTVEEITPTYTQADFMEENSVAYSPAGFFVSVFADAHTTSPDDPDYNVNVDLDEPMTVINTPSGHISFVRGVDTLMYVTAGRSLGPLFEVGSFAVWRENGLGGAVLTRGADATTGGLTFAGGLYTSGTLSVSAGDVSGLAAVATSGDYADITGGPPATTTVSLSYNSGTKDLTVTVNGVSDTINLT